MRTIRLLLSLLLTGSALRAATFTVTNTNDTGAGSLRAALASAAAAGGADDINFAAGLSGQTITLISGSLATTDAAGVTVDASALPGGITLQANGSARVFYHSSGGVLTLRGLTLTGGTNASGGGVIYNDHATLTIERCTITGGSSSVGAGVLTEVASTTTLRQCTFSGNTATSQGGALYNRGTSILIHCTLKGNASQGDAGGIYNQAGSGLTLENSIVGGNTATAVGQDVLNFGTLTRNGANIVQAGVDGNGALAGGGSIATGNPFLSALGFFGGPTRVMLPEAGSPAIDKAVGSTETVDQRGFPRPVDLPSASGSAADIGAVEAQLPDANLSNLVLSAGTLSPAFAAATTSYTSTVPVGTASITVTPTASNVSASITVNNASVATGTPSGSIALNIGANTITTVVTAPDGFPVKTSTVTVYRPSVAGEIFVTTANDTGSGSVRDVFDAVNDALNTGPAYTTINLLGRSSNSGATFNPYPLLRPKGGSVTIEGNGGTLDGGGASRPIFIYSGNVTLRNLTLANTKAFGGNATGGGGGGAGLGGAIFIYKGANVTAENVTFSASSATGGNGGDDGGPFEDYYIAGGGGGGMGGHGGLAAGIYSPGTGGGGLGGDGGLGGGGIRSGVLTAQGGGGGAEGGFFGPLGGARGAGNSIRPAGKDGGGGSGPSFSLPGGSAGGGGLAGYWALDTSSGAAIHKAAPHTINGGWGGGGGGGGAGSSLIGAGGAGGFGGGGGGGGTNGGNSHANGGPGGFGGGGGGSSDADTTGGTGGQYTSGGAGGFGGGGGAGGLGQDGIGGGGAGGFGAGNGGSGDPGQLIRRCGGGGLGAGGAIFVMTGATITLFDPVFTGNFTVTGGNAGGPGAGAGQGVGAGVFLGGNATINVSLNNTITLPNVPDFIGGGNDPEAAGGLTKSGAGTLVFSNSNSYVGGTTLAAGVLSVSADNQLGGATGALAFAGGTLRVTGTTFATTSRNISFGAGGGFDIADAAHTFTLSQSFSGAGGLTKAGAGTLALGGNSNYAGTTNINAGTLQLDNGLGGAGDTVTVASGATLRAKGNVSRRIAGAGTITANNAALILGDLSDANGFNLNSGAGGTLNIGSNQVVLFSQSKAVLGAQTNLGAGATLVTVNGLQLGNAASVDAAKVLTAAGPAMIQGRFTNNGVVHGPAGAGQQLAFQNAVNGAGNFTGNIRFDSGYSPGNSPASVTLQNATFSPVNILTMELGGTSPGSGHDHLNVTGTAALGGTLIVSLINGFTPAAGQSFDLLDGNTVGSFTNLSLPPLPAGLVWNTSQLSSSGTISVISLTAIEAWRLTHFGSTADFGNGANLFDFDLDGLVNLIEFAFGQDPKLSSSAQLPALQLGGGNLTFQFTTPAGVNGITYGAEWSTTLQANDWHAIPDTGTPPEHIFTISTGANQRMFMRFRITDP